MPYTREQAESQKKYRENNKEKMAEKNRKYWEANREKLAEKGKKYHEANKEKRNENQKKYYEANKEKMNEKNRKYHEANREKIKQYNQTPIGKRNRRIVKWRSRGIKLPEEYGENWDIFYEEEYLSTTKCEECSVELTEDKMRTSTTKCLDHDHNTGDFRNILCHVCNIQRG